MSHDTAIHRLVRPAVRLAARAGVTPNQLTTLRLATGLAAAVSFAQGPYGWMVAGGLVFLVSMLLDRADGDLARLLGRASRVGHWYDLAADGIAGVAAFLGLGIGVSAAAAEPTALWLGIVAGVGIAMLFFELNVLKIATVRGCALFGGRLMVDPDDAMILVPILVWADLALPTVIAAAVAAPSAAVVVAFLSLRRRWLRDGAAKRYTRNT